MISYIWKTSENENNEKLIEEENEEENEEANEDDEIDDGLPRRPMVFRRFYNRLKEECSKEINCDGTSARASPAEIEEKLTDDRKPVGDAMNLNYGDFIFQRESGRHELDVRLSTRHHDGPLQACNDNEDKRANGIPSLDDSPPKPKEAPQSASDRQSLQFDDRAGENSGPSPPKKSYSAYLRRP